MRDFEQLVRQLREFWSRQELAGRAVYSGIAVLVVVAVVGVGFWSTQVNYAVLYSGLPTDEAAAIVQKLEADRTTFQLSSDGTSILVPTDRVQKVRMSLAVAGLPQGSGKGFEIFDSMSMGTTPFVQNLNYVRAIQGELARTIMTLEPVVHARVHVVQPEPTPFVREEQPVTASVVIKTRPGTTLSRRATEGIVALVAGSVKGLSSEHVTVLDSDGRVLSEKKHERAGMASADQLSHQLEVESHLATKAQEILTRLLGPGRAVVRVTADMSFRHVDESSVKFDPEGKVVLREAVMSSKATGANPTRGPAGTATNIPPGVPSNGQTTPIPTANEETIESEYVVSHVDRTQKEQQENIHRLTVAVILIPTQTDPETPPEESLGITPVEAKELVKQAVGFKEGRDQIQVSIGKSTPAPAEAAFDQEVIAFQTWQNYASVVRASSLGVAAVALLAIGLLAFRRRSAPHPAPIRPAFASATSATAEFDDLNAVAGTIRAWLETPATIRMDRSAAAGNGSKPA